MKEIIQKNDNKKIVNDKENNKKIKRIIILIILIIIVIVTSFVSGRRFFEIKNSSFDNSYSDISSSVAKWSFKVKIKYNEED